MELGREVHTGSGEHTQASSSPPPKGYRALLWGKAWPSSPSDLFNLRACLVACFVVSSAGLIFIRMLELFRAVDGKHLEEGQAVGSLGKRHLGLEDQGLGESGPENPRASGGRRGIWIRLSAEGDMEGHSRNCQGKRRNSLAERLQC